MAEGPERPPDRTAEVLRNRLISDVLDTMRRGLNVAHRPEYPQSHSDWRVAVDAMLSMFEVTRLPLARPWPPAELPAPDRVAPVEAREVTAILAHLLGPGTLRICDPETERHHFETPLFYGQRCACGAAWVIARPESPGHVPIGFMLELRPRRA